VFRYAASVGSYLTPPVAHPWLGELAVRFQADQGHAAGLLERQLYVGWGPLLLAAVAVFGWRGARGRDAWMRGVPALVLMAVAALVCSLPPEWRFGAVTLPMPSGALHAVVPMFRAYARFGVLVQLSVAMLAGIGAAWLWRTAGRGGQVVVAVSRRVRGQSRGALARRPADGRASVDDRWARDGPGCGLCPPFGGIGVDPVAEPGTDRGARRFARRLHGA